MLDPRLEKARSLLTGDVTCVICREGEPLLSRSRGVRPLLDWLDAGVSCRDGWAADRVIGRATAFLYCLLGIRGVYTPVISTPALQVLEAHDILACFDREVPQIRNRTGDGRCPMETATLDCRTPEEALLAVRDALSNFM